jgi:hypothetical protein
LGLHGAGRGLGKFPLRATLTLTDGTATFVCAIGAFDTSAARPAIFPDRAMVLYEDDEPLLLDGHQARPITWTTISQSG